MEEKSMFSQLVKKTRSYRNFDPSVRLGPDDLARMIDLCRFTASSANKQPLKFAYAFKREDCARILPHLGWAGYLTEKPPYPGKEPAAYILICNDTAISPNCPDTDVGICAQTIVLAAMEKGIGACMLGSIDKTELSAIFSLPETIVPRLMIALGAPNEKIVLTEAVDGSIKYYRDEAKTHYVPKRPLREILLPEIG